jgi:hypothetical protein
LNKLTASYLAGLIDGEGCLDIPLSTNGYYKSRLRIALINKELIYWLKDSFGGSIYERKGIGKNRDSYCWTLENKKVLKPFLQKVYPYLKIKKEEAIVMLKFFKTFSENSFIKTVGGGQHLKQEVIDQRVNYSKEIKLLKRVCSVND